MKKQFDYIKESTFSFLLDEKISMTKAKAFVLLLVKDIGMDLVHLQENILEPGFDLCATIKQSIIYLGYWHEWDYVRIIVSSCKPYDETIVIEKIEEFFKLKGDLKCEVNKDIEMKEEVKLLC